MILGEEYKLKPIVVRDIHDGTWSLILQIIYAVNSHTSTTIVYGSDNGTYAAVSHTIKPVKQSIDKERIKTLQRKAARGDRDAARELRDLQAKERLEKVRRLSLGENK
jgi:hypothetical protein